MMMAAKRATKDDDDDDDDDDDEYEDNDMCGWVFSSNVHAEFKGTPGRQQCLR